MPLSTCSKNRSTSFYVHFLPNRPNPPNFQRVLSISARNLSGHNPPGMRPAAPGADGRPRAHVRPPYSVPARVVGVEATPSIRCGSRGGIKCLTEPRSCGAKFFFPPAIWRHINPTLFPLLFLGCPTSSPHFTSQITQVLRETACGPAERLKVMGSNLLGKIQVKCPPKNVLTKYSRC